MHRLRLALARRSAGSVPRTEIKVVTVSEGEPSTWKQVKVASALLDQAAARIGAQRGSNRGSFGEGWSRQIRRKFGVVA
jgi:hypothetical protein